MMNPRKIIIDTDIGDDIDDAFAIALAVCSPELQLAGVTTVFRNAERRAKMCRLLLDSYGKGTLPICAGIDQPLLQNPPHLSGDRTAPDGSFIPCQFTSEMEACGCDAMHAVDFLIRTIRKSPGEVTLVPIAPLTNIAVAIRMAPDIVGKVRSICLMGGYFTQNVAEWNILCDPEAADIVFRSGIPIQAIGLDVTLRCKLEGRMLEDFRLLRSRSASVLNTMMAGWLESGTQTAPVLHDPLVIASLADPTLVEFQPRTVKIARNAEDYGKTQVVPAETPRSAAIDVAVDVDRERFLHFLRNRLFG